MKPLKPIIILHFTVLVVLNATAQIETVIQKGHDAVVKAVAFSPDGKLIATASRDKTAKLWDLKTGREIRTFFGHKHTVNHIAFSTSGQYLITSSADHTAKIWDINSGKIIFSTPIEDKLLSTVAISPDGKWLATGGYDTKAKIWDMKSQKVIHELKVNPDQGTGYGINLTFSSDGKWLSIGEDNRAAHIYNTKNWEKTITMKPEIGWCGGCGTMVAFSPDQQLIAKQSNNDSLKIYNTESGKLLHTLGDKQRDVRGVIFLSTQKSILSATEKEVRLWNWGNKRDTAIVVIDDKAFINDIAFDPNKKWLATAHNDNITRIWTLEGKLIKTLSGVLNNKDKGGILYDPNNYWQSHIAKYIKLKNNIILSKDGNKLIRGKFGAHTKMWDIATGQSTMEYIGHQKATITYDLNSKGDILATAGGDGDIILWNVKKGNIIKKIKAHRDIIFEIQFGKDDQTIISSSWDGTVKIFDVNTGERLQYINFSDNSAYSIAFTPNNLYIMVGMLNKKLEMYEIDSKSLVRQFIGHTDVISSISFFAKGQRMVTTSWDGSARIWDINTGLMTHKFKKHTGPVYDAKVIKNGQQLITTGMDRQIMISDINTGDIIKILEGHQAEITSLVVNESKNMLISHSLDGVTKFWDLDKGKEFFEHIHIGKKDWLVKDPQGYFNGTSDAFDIIHFVEGTNSYAADQFFEQFYRPDLLPQVFKTRGSGGNYKGVIDQLNSFPPPTVNINAFASRKEGYGDLYIRLIDNGGGVERTKLLHNGKNLATNNFKRIDYKEKGDTVSYQIQLPLVSGKNTFTLSAFSKGKVESHAEVISLYAEKSTKVGVCHVMSIGIDQYKNTALNLNYAGTDAKSITDLLTTKNQAIFSEIKHYSLYDSYATKNAILKKLDSLSGVINPEDVFIFYYAGHGSMVDQKFYFIPTENVRLYDPKNIEKTAISAHVLQEKLQKIHALKQVIIMDACQSGGSVEILAQRGAVEEKAMAQLARSTGIHILASAGSEQFAAEFSELGHGLFTYVLLEALKGKADGAPKDGKITIYELKSYLDDQVPAYNIKFKGQSQYPFTFSRGRDFPITIVKEGNIPK